MKSPAAAEEATVPVLVEATVSSEAAEDEDASDAEVEEAADAEEDSAAADVDEEELPPQAARLAVIRTVRAIANFFFILIPSFPFSFFVRICISIHFPAYLISKY